MRKLILITLIVGGLFVALPASANNRILSLNTGSANSTWFITGEPSLVMNGFDLNALGVTRPVQIASVSLGVAAPIPGSLIDVVIYEDANGGSPADARIAGRQQVDITTTGTFTVTFATPVTITQPVIWVGFYLPVDFRFLADRSGTSVLTYWAWTPGGRFDVANLSSASILGPSDGTAPVSINLNGKARITVELIGGGTDTTGTTGTTPPVTTADVANTAALLNYPLCANLLYDTADELISYGNRINMHCSQPASFLAPVSPSGFTLRGTLYDILAFKDGGIMPSRFEVRITHCIRPDAADIDRAVIGSAWGSPRRWEILPTARLNDLICAEVRYPGNLAYFVR